MRINHRLVVFDAADIAAESAFWVALLGGVLTRAEEDWHQIEVGGEPAVAVQLAPDHVPPDWPGGSPPQQIHLDLQIDDHAAAHTEVSRLGGRVVQDPVNDGRCGFQVYADPAGHPFCLCWG